jgi:hypothetical protein
MPSTCGSKYLIITTNTDDNDRKVTSAGYGPINVDLGSPGQDVYTTGLMSLGGYQHFGGTSGAAPHVTGVIALLYSAACEDLLEHAKKYPDSVALLMKKFILDGTDQNNTLISKTVSGGRLNAYGAIRELMIWCNTWSIQDHPDYRLKISRIYPNPATQSLNIEIHSGMTLSLNLEVHNTIGQLISYQQILIKYGKSNHEIPISELASGLYIIRAVSENGSILYSNKFIKN